MSAFLWGVATGAHQTEGNNLASDWWAIEHEPGSFVKEPSGDAVDSFHRWREDMDLAAGAGFTDYRFGVEWSRVEPVEGFFSRAAIDHYRRMVEGARARGLRPFVTLHHFTVPLWFAATGGWFRTDATEKYLRYVEAIEPVPTDSVEHVGTINEPNIVAMLARRKEGEAPGLSRGLPLPDPRVTDALIDVHHTTRAKLKAAHPHLRVGWGISVQDCQPEPGAESVFATYVHPRDEVFAEAARGNHWVGVQTYTRIRVGIADGRPVEIAGDGPKTLPGWEYYPDALGGALRRIARVVGETPIIVTGTASPPTTITSASSTRVRRSRQCRKRSATASTFAATCTGAWSTTTNGETTDRLSAWSPLTGAASNARPDRHCAGSGLNIHLGIGD